MPPITLSALVQILVGLGLLNVWLVRPGSATAYRGGDARSLREEFDAYGLPEFMFYLVGALKVGAGLALIAGLWLPSVVTPAAALVSALMVGALAMHLKVRDPFTKWVPALLMLILSASLLVLG